MRFLLCVRMFSLYRHGATDWFTVYLPSFTSKINFRMEIYQQLLYVEKSVRRTETQVYPL